LKDTRAIFLNYFIATQIKLSATQKATGTRWSGAVFKHATGLQYSSSSVASPVGNLRY
jgi:hypothetical protein